MGAGGQRYPVILNLVRHATVETIHQRALKRHLPLASVHHRRHYGTFQRAVHTRQHTVEGVADCPVHTHLTALHSGKLQRGMRLKVHIVKLHHGVLTVQSRVPHEHVCAGVRE